MAGGAQIPGKHPIVPPMNFENLKMKESETSCQYRLSNDVDES
jgi:hypothetical protein